MKQQKEILKIADRLSNLGNSELLVDFEPALSAIEAAANVVGRAFSGSWLGYHSHVYYADFQPPPSGARFSQEWGLKDMSYTSLGTKGDWVDYDPHDVKSYILETADNPDLTRIKEDEQNVAGGFRDAKSELESILTTIVGGEEDKFLSKILKDLADLEPLSPFNVAQHWCPKGQVISRDMVAISQHNQIPPHISVKSEIVSLRNSYKICLEGASIAKKAMSHIGRKSIQKAKETRIGTNVFIGHGRSPLWRELKDFVEDRLQLPADEFNRVPVAGITNQTRLAEMLDAAAIAFIIMTAEDQIVDGDLQARMNVVHEVGLFQGRLGFTRAIIVLEEGCAEFSNISGLGQIRFPAKNISACFEEIRRVAEREGLV